MTVWSIPIEVVSSPTHIAARPRARWAGAVVPAAATARLAQDFRLVADTRGTITNNNRVMRKADPDAPELPAANIRVRLHRLADGRCAWEGFSDADGYYWPAGLEVGVEYYPVAIDHTRTHEVDSAGPVVAVRAPA